MSAVFRRSLAALFVFCLVVGALAPAPARAAKDPLDELLVQVDRSIKGLRGISADIAVTDVREGKEENSPTGRAWIETTSGKVRLEADGEVPKVFIAHPGTLWIHRPADMTVDEFPLQHHRGRLAPYTVLGFAVAGSKLKKDYVVSLIGETELDGQKTVLIDLTPRSDTVRTYLRKVELWLDPASGLPAQQRMYHHAADTQLTVRYTNVTRDDKMKGNLFQPKWPKGTEIRKK